MRKTKAMLEAELEQRDRELRLLRIKLNNAERTIAVTQERAAICDRMFASIADTQTAITMTLAKAKELMREAEIERLQDRWRKELMAGGKQA